MITIISTDLVEIVLISDLNSLYSSNKARVLILSISRFVQSTKLHYII